MFQSKAGYIDARPLTASSTKISCNARPDHTFGSNPDFLLGGRTSASAECRHWSGRAVRWSSCAILLRFEPLELNASSGLRTLGLETSVRTEYGYSLTICQTPPMPSPVLSPFFLSPE